MLLIFILLPLLANSKIIKTEERLTYKDAVQYCYKKSAEIIAVRLYSGEYWLPNEGDNCFYYSEGETINTQCNEKFDAFCADNDVSDKFSRIYEVYNEPTSFDEAQRFCSSITGSKKASRLITIESHKLNVLQNASQTKYWTGSSFVGIAEFTSSDTSFRRFLPNDRPKGRSSCVAINLKDDVNNEAGEWSINDCSAKYGFICEVDHFERNPSIGQTGDSIAKQGQCRPGFYEFSNNCYLIVGSDWHDVSANRSSTEVTDQLDKNCQQSNSHLAIVPSLLHASFLRLILRKHFKTSEEFWIAGKYSTHDQSFIWPKDVNYKRTTTTRSLITSPTRLVHLLGQKKYHCLLLDQKNPYLVLSHCESLKNTPTGYICSYPLGEEEKKDKDLLDKGKYCPPTWTLYMGQCYSQPLTSTTPMDFNDARFTCDWTMDGNNRANVLSLNNHGEEEFIKFLLSSSHPIAEQPRNVWLGLEFTKHESENYHWHWSDNSDIVYTNFGLGQPKIGDAMKGSILLNYDSYNNQTSWSTVYSDQTYANTTTICKMPAQIMPPKWNSIYKKMCNRNETFCFSVIPRSYGLLRGHHAATDLCRAYHSDMHAQLLEVTTMGQHKFIMEKLAEIQVPDDLYLIGNNLELSPPEMADLISPTSEINIHYPCLAVNVSRASLERNITENWVTIGCEDAPMPILCGFDNLSDDLQSGSTLESLGFHKCPEMFSPLHNHCIHISSITSLASHSDVPGKCHEMNAKSGAYNISHDLHVDIQTLSIIGSTSNVGVWLQSDVETTKCQTYPHLREDIPTDCNEKHRFVCQITPPIAADGVSQPMAKTITYNVIDMLGVTFAQGECPNGFVFFNLTNTCYRIVKVPETTTKDVPAINDAICRVGDNDNVTRLHKLTGPILELHLTRLLMQRFLTSPNMEYNVYVDKNSLGYNGWYKETLIFVTKLSEIMQLEMNTIEFLRHNELAITANELTFISNVNRTNNSRVEYALCSQPLLLPLESKREKDLYEFRNVDRETEDCPRGSIISNYTQMCIYTRHLCLPNVGFTPPNVHGINMSRYYESLVDALQLETIHRVNLHIDSFNEHLMFTWNGDTSFNSFRSVLINKAILDEPTSNFHFFIGRNIGNNDTFHIIKNGQLFMNICQTPMKLNKLSRVHINKMVLNYDEASRNCPPGMKLTIFRNQEDFDVLTKTMSKENVTEAWIRLRTNRGSLIWQDSVHFVKYFPTMSRPGLVTKHGACFVVKHDEKATSPSFVIEPRSCVDSIARSACSVPHEFSEKEHYSRYHITSFECPQGYVLYEEKCFRLFQEPATWHDADATCRKNDGGQLATPEYAQQNDFLQSMLYPLKSNRIMSNPGYPSVWIYSQSHLADQFKWQSLTRDNYTSFATRQVLPTQPGNCISMLRSMDPYMNGQWFIEECRTRLDGYICQRPALKTKKQFDRFHDDVNCDLGGTQHPVKSYCYKIHYYYEKEIDDQRMTKVILMDPFDAAFLRSFMASWRSYSRTTLDLKFDGNAFLRESGKNGQVLYTDFANGSTIKSLLMINMRRDNSRLMFAMNDRTQFTEYLNLRPLPETKDFLYLPVIYQYETLEDRTKHQQQHQQSRPNCSHNDNSWTFGIVGNLTRPLAFSRIFKGPNDFGQLNTWTKSGRQCDRWDLSNTGNVTSDNYFIMASEMVNGESWPSYAENYCSHLITLDNPNTIHSYGCFVDDKFEECEKIACNSDNSIITPNNNNNNNNEETIKIVKSHPIVMSLSIFIVIGLILGLVYVFIRKRRTNNIAYTRQLNFGSPPTAYDSPFRAVDGWNNDLSVSYHKNSGKISPTYNNNQLANENEINVDASPYSTDPDDHHQLVNESGGSLFIKGMNPFQTNRQGYQKVEDEDETTGRNRVY